MAQVFISKSDKYDMDQALLVLEKLESNGISCWMSPRDVSPDKAYEYSIMPAIRECSVFLLLLSRDAQASEHVARELEYVSELNNNAPKLGLYGRKKPVLVYALDGSPLNDQFNYLLTGLPRIPAYQHDEEAALNMLLEAVCNALDIPVTDPAPEREPLREKMPRKEGAFLQKVPGMLLTVILTVLYSALLVELALKILPPSLAESDLFMVLSLVVGWLPARATARYIIDALRRGKK